jgi:hypothetical protein
VFIIYSRAAVLPVLAGIGATFLIAMIPYLNFFCLLVGGAVIMWLDLRLRQEEWPDSMWWADNAGHIFFLPVWLYGLVIVLIGLLPVTLLLFSLGGGSTT